MKELRYNPFAHVQTHAANVLLIFTGARHGAEKTHKTTKCEHEDITQTAGRNTRR